MVSEAFNCKLQFVGFFFLSEVDNGEGTSSALLSDVSEYHWLQVSSSAR